MNKMLKKILSLTLTFLTIMSLCTVVWADNTDITFSREDTAKITFTKGKNAWTASDLFDNFKNVMPGDTKTQDITLTNKTGEDTLHVYLSILPHDLENNQIDKDALEGKFVAATWTDENGDPLTGEALLKKMSAFLGYMTFTIYQGQETITKFTGNEPFEGSVELCAIPKGETATITVQLEVSKDMENEFAHKAAEVDWKFTGIGITNKTLTVRKNWEDNGYPKRPSSVTVYLLKDGVKTGEKVVLNKSNNWTDVFTDLSDEFTWTVEEEVPDGYDAKITYKDDGKVFITNHMDYTPYIPWYPTPDPKPDPEPDKPIETEPVETEPEETKPEETKPDETEPPETEIPPEEPVVRDLTVRKAWAEDKADERPTSVTVALYNGENEVEKVVLGDWNDWSYTWYDLDCNDQWSVLEVDIPLGYTPSYAADGDTVVITNNAILIQTGQLNWPIPVLCGLGVLLIGGGVLLMRKKKENNDA